MSTSFLKISLCLVLLSLTACAVGPDFKKPQIVTPDTYGHSNDTKSSGTQHIVYGQQSTAWWKEFHSPVINQVIIDGISGSFDLKEMQERLAEAREKVTAASGQLWPQINLNADAGRQKYGVALFGPSNFTIPPFTYYEFGPSVSYTLDVFGGTRRTIEKQQALAEYQHHELQGTFLNLTGNITTTIISIAAINEKIAAAEEIVNEDNRNLNFVRQAFALGSGTRVDVLSAQSQKANDETLLPPLRQQLTVAKDELITLLGKTPATWVSPNFRFKQFNLPRRIALIVPSELVHKRPDILAAEAMLHAANADVGIATANLYPSVTLTGSLLQEALTPGALFHASSTAWSILGGINAPIFSGGTLLANKRGAVHAYKAAYANYQKVVIKAFSQVNDALHAIKEDEINLRAQNRALATAQESLRLTRISYNAGGVGVLDVLDAQRRYTQAKLGFVQAKAQQFQDSAQLYVALGG